MKLRKMLYGLSFLLSAFALNSCINEDSVCLPESNEAKVVFSLVLPDNAQTRANEVWSDTYDPEKGTDYDNFIDLNGIQVLVFNLHDDTEKSDLYQGTINDFMYTKTGDNVYTYYGTAPAELSATGTYKFVVLANCSKVTDKLTINESKITALDNLGYTLADMQYIPMWGVLQAELALVPGQRYNIGNIYLLRAISKVTVKLSDTMIQNGYTLKSVSVDKYNSSGYVLPAGASTVTDTRALDQEACINVPEQTAATNMAGTITNNETIIYLPEYANATSKDATMSVVVVDPKGKEMEFLGEDGISFKNYVNGVATNGSDYDIVRNHHYSFTITSAEIYHKLTLIVQTVPWEDESVTVDYTETIEWKQDAGPRWATPTTTVITTEGDFSVLNVNGGDDLSCSFTLDAPEGWLWYAELEPLTTGASNFITFNDGTTFASGSVGQAATLYVKIATGSADVTHRSRLRLYVRTPSGDKSLEVRNLYYIISRSI